MNIRIQVQGFSLTPSISARVHLRFNKALERFADELVDVDVFLKDINGPKGGNDKLALARVRLRFRPPVMVETSRDDLYVAIDQTARRMRRAVKRSLRRNQQLLRNGSRRLRQARALPAS